MKKLQLTAAALAGMCLLASCGAKSAYEQTNLAADSYSMQRDEAYGDNYEEYYESAAEESKSDYSIEAEAADYKQADVKAINTQMLVYSCDMSIDVLEFDDSVDKLHDLITKYKGFIESETYSDGGNTSKWQYTDEQKWKTLSTIIRVPSASYDDFCNDAENVGDMRRKNASVQNLTTEYSDLKTTLSIYEAKEKRYINLLADMKSESDALAVEKDLTDIQVEIAKIKTRMNNIENDVAYSYINLTVNEVREYTEEPVIEKTDTFGQRLANTVSRTWRGFLEFLEGLLFLIIRLLPYLLLIGIVLIPINLLRKSIKKKRAARDKAWYQAHKNAQPEPMNTAASASPEEKDTAQKEKE
jgi:hypothetical protein